MKVIIEKEEAHLISFDKFKDYPVFKNYNENEILGTAKVLFENETLFADITFIKSAKGFPAIGFTKKGKLWTLDMIGICDSPNVDKSIQPIKYTFNLEGKPSNLKTK